MAKVIYGKSAGLVDAMEKAGILPEHCRRVIIDIDWENMVYVHYETFGDERLLDVDFAKHIGAMIAEKKKAGEK